MKIRRLDQTNRKPSSPRQYIQSRQKQMTQTYDDLKSKYGKKKKVKNNQNVKENDEKKEKNEKMGDEQDLEINYNQTDPHIVQSELERQGIDVRSMRFKQMQGLINKKRSMLNRDVKQFNNMLAELASVEDKQREIRNRVQSRKQ